MLRLGSHEGLSCTHSHPTPPQVPYLPSDDPEENLYTAFNIAEQLFDVPHLLDPDDMANFSEQVGSESQWESVGIEALATAQYCFAADRAIPGGSGLRARALGCVG